jgi:hypothetical protein
MAVTCGNVLARIQADVLPKAGGQGVASSNLASPTKPMDAIRPSRTRNQPIFLPPSITPSDGRSGPATDHQAENAVPASSMACTSGCR